MKRLILRRKLPITHRVIIKLPFTIWSVLVGRKIKPEGCYQYKIGGYTYRVIVCLIDNKYYYRLPYKRAGGQDMRKHFGLKRKKLKLK